MNISICRSKNNESQDLSFLMLAHDMIAVTNYGNTWVMPASRFFGGVRIHITKKVAHVDTASKALQSITRIFARRRLKPVDVYTLAIQIPSGAKSLNH